MDNTTPDSDTLERAREGDREAFARLYEALLPIAWRVAWTATADQSASEEVVGDTMLAMVDSLPTLPETYPRLVAWVRTVVRNKSVDWVRRQSRHRKAQRDVLVTSEGRRGEAMAADDFVLQAETCDEVRAALMSLDETSRSVLVMRYVRDLSCSEIAEILGLSSSATNSLLYRSRNRFRDAMNWVPEEAERDAENDSAADFATIRGGSHRG